MVVRGAMDKNHRQIARFQWAAAGVGVALRTVDVDAHVEVS
jgi:hypothetical protein